jgi:hypothetical protein
MKKTTKTEYSILFENDLEIAVTSNFKILLDHLCIIIPYF